MVERHLKLHQMLALLPVAVPECVLDFLEDLGGDLTPLTRPKVRTSIETSYLQQKDADLKKAIEDFRKDFGEITQVSGEALGKEVPGGYLCKVVFEKGSRGIGFTVKLRENQIIKIAFTLDDFKPDELKKQLQS